MTGSRNTHKMSFSDLRHALQELAGIPKTPALWFTSRATTQVGTHPSPSPGTAPELILQGSSSASIKCLKTIHTQGRQWHH